MPTMTLITSNWNGVKTFRLIPMSLDSAFSEGIYDPTNKVLVLFSSKSKDSVHLVPRLNENGDIIKTKAPRPDGKMYKEQRVTLDTFVEYFVSEKEEIKIMVKKLADNADEFDYESYLNAMTIVETETVPQEELVTQE